MIGRLVTYDDGTTAVELGDHVEMRVWLWKSRGRVVYVPGLSNQHEEMEFGGLTWVGVSLTDGSLVKTVVHPQTMRLKKSVKFAGRGTEPIRPVRPSDNLVEE